MVDKHIFKMYNHGIIRKEICIINENTLKKSTHFISVIFNVASIIAIIVDIGAILLLGGTLLSQIMRPGYLAKQMINAEMELVFSEWVVLLVCFIIKCSCIFLAIRYSKKLFYCISKQESPFTANTTKCINIIAIFIFASMVCPLYPYYHISFLSIIEGIFIVLIFRSITLIFKYGCNLQKEIDETL